MQTKLSNKLYQKTFKHYDNFKDDDERLKFLFKLFAKQKNKEILI